MLSWKFWLPVIASAIVGRKLWHNFKKVYQDDFRKTENKEPVPTPLEMLLEDMSCVFSRDPAARSWLEIATIYPGVQAINTYRFTHWLWVNNFNHIARCLTGVEIHPGAIIGRRFFIDHGLGTVIGETAEIGNDVTLYHQVTLGGTSWNPGKRHPTLGNNIVVGAGAKILGPITVHDGARVGANSVVIKEVPSGKTVVGVPGRTVADVKTETRLEVARSLGFDAYGMQKSMPDPIANVINRMLDHIHVMDQRQMKMCEALGRIGELLPEDDRERIKLEVCHFAPLADDKKLNEDESQEQ